MRVLDKGFCLLLVLMLLSVALGAANRRVISFAGMDWWVKSGHYGPGPNHFSDSAESVWVDENGKLHLKIRQIGGLWHCAEVWSLVLACWVNYLFLLESQVDLYDPNVVAGLFLYQDDDHEIDIEFSRWGDPDYPCGSYSVQPYYHQGNNRAFAMDLQGSWTSHSFNWQPDYIDFQSLHGHYSEASDDGFIIDQWHYTGADNPAESPEMLLHINLWLMSGLSPTDASEAELIVSHLVITPRVLTTPPALRIQQLHPESVLLSWDPVPNALSYQVFQSDIPLNPASLGWTELTATSATSLELSSQARNKFFYVRALRE